MVPDYIGVVGQAQKYSVKQIDLAQLNQAIQQFNAAEGRYPNDLQELVPNYLAKIPQVPPGYQISYDATSGKVKVVHAVKSFSKGKIFQHVHFFLENEFNGIVFELHIRAIAPLSA